MKHPFTNGQSGTSRLSGAIILLLILSLFSWEKLGAQVQIYQESFETNGNPARYTTSPAEFSSGTNGCNDFFTRKSDEGDAANNTTCPSALYNDPANEDGTVFFASEDDDNGNPKRVTLAAQNVTGQSSLDVRILMATPRTGRFEAIDFFDVKYQMDGGSITTIASFHGTGTSTNLQLDTDNNGIGDGTALTQDFADFTFPIGVTGNSLVVIIEMGQNGGTEEQAFDNVRIFGIATANDPPVLAAIESSVLAYVENDGGKQITNTITNSDTDDTDFEGATISIVNNLRSCEDVLMFSNQNGISGVWNSTTGVLTLTGTSSLANYQTALRSVQYSNSNAVHPDTSRRTVRFIVDDGTNTSGNQDRFIDISRSLTTMGSLPFQESFETDGLGVRYDANRHTDGTNDVWDRLSDPNTQVVNPTGEDGSFYWGGNDIDATTGTGDNCENGNPGGPDGHVTTHNININGFANLQVTIAAAALTVAGWDVGPPNDKIEVLASIDGGPFTYVGGWFGNGTNLEEDTNGNQAAGPAGTTLNATFQDGTFNISGTGTTLAIRVQAHANSGAEELAIDNIRVTGSPACVATTVTTHPTNATVCPGTPAAFTADTTGGTADSLRWHCSTNGGATWNIVQDTGSHSGSQTLMLSINPASLFFNGRQYRLVAYSCSGANTDSSNAAMLTTLDVIPPSITCPNDTIVLANSACMATYSWVAPVPTDNCPGVFAVGSLNSPQTFMVGLNPIVYVASDLSGNTDTCTWNVIPLSPIVWNEFVGSVQSNDTLFRTAPGNSWGTSGAVSVQALLPNIDGGVFHVVGSNKFPYFFGFSESNVDAFNISIDHAFYVHKASLYVREASGTKMFVGPANIGDTLAIRRVSNQMVWFRNNAPVFAKPVDPNKVLFADVSMYKSGTWLTNLFVDFCTTAPLGLTWQKTNNTCTSSPSGAIDITPFAGTPPYTYSWSHGPITQDVSGLDGGTYTVTVTDFNTSTAMMSFTIMNRLSWTDMTGSMASDDTLTKTVSGNNWFSSGARSTQVLAPDSNGSFTHIVKVTNKYYYIGFDNTNNGPDQLSMDYTFYVASGILRIREATGYFASHGTVTVGDTLTIQRMGSVINYYQNGNLLRTASAIASNQLFVSATIYNANVSLCDNFVTFCSDSLIPNAMMVSATWDHANCFLDDGSANVMVSGGVPPYTYTWTPNVSSMATISNQPKGMYKCVISDMGGNTDSVSFELFNKIVWENTVGSMANGDTLMHTAASSAWGNSGARSDNKLLNGTDGKIVHVVNSVGYNYYFGLNDEDVDQSPTSINYAIYNHKGSLKIREEGTGFNQFLNLYVEVGDTLTIERRISSVFYYLNDSLLRSVGTGSMETLRVDVSMYTMGTTIFDMYVDFCDTIAGMKQGMGNNQLLSLSNSTDLVIFPNPTSDAFTLQMTGVRTEIAVLEMMDIFGKSLSRRDISIEEGQLIEERIDLSQQAPGTYILRLTSGNEVLTRKILKF